MLALFLAHNIALSQTIQEIITRLRDINKNVDNESCNKGHAGLISNRAANLFLAYRSGYYLSGYDDMSFRKNYVNYNTTTGSLSLNHNFFQAKGNDSRVRSFFVAGIEAQAVKPQSAFWPSYSSDLNAVIKQTWIAPTNFFVGDCSAKGSQKQIMDAHRAVILKTIESQLRSAAKEFEQSLDSLTQSTASGQSLEAVKLALRNKFYSDLDLCSAQKFVALQEDALTETNNYVRTSTHWTNISANLPLIGQQFAVAETYQTSFASYKAFPFLITLSHTRFWESWKTGKIFLTAKAQLALNNSFLSNRLLETSLGDYKVRGGSDTTAFSNYQSPKYIGKFESFITPIFAIKCAYFPSDSHIGISISAEKNFLDYVPLNFKLGIPVVLIDKEGHPAANFEFLVLYYDATNTAFPNMKLSDKTSVGITVSVPFSKVIY